MKCTLPAVPASSMCSIALALLLLMPMVSFASGIERFQAYLRTMQSARGEFEQKVFDRNRKLVQEAKGSFAFQRPDRFRWTYLSPTPQLIVGDGERLWIYDQELNQVSVRRLSGALGATPAVLLAGRADIEKLFELSDAGTRDGLEWLEARPRERDAGFERVRIGLGVGDVRAMELIDAFGQTTLLRFVNVQRNPGIDPATFRFVPPKGADVVGETGR